VSDPKTTNPAGASSTGSQPADNREQLEYWNGVAGQRWVQNQPLIDRGFVAFGAAVLALARARRGERVLDVGCGAGATVLELSRAVGEGGHVVGVDVSKPLLALARERCAGVSNVTLIEADASRFSQEAPFDLLLSRFGVMFFADPIAAFVNLRRLLAPKGRLALLCWQRIEDNPWCSVPLEAVRTVIGDVGGLPAAGEPGPFAFADATYLRSVLGRAGFVEVEVTSHIAPVVLNGAVEGRAPIDVAREASDFLLRAGPVARLLADRSDAERGRVQDELVRQLASRVTPQGVALDGATWLVSAR
jgi:SAM-dependent methyltransferase